VKSSTALAGALSLLSLSGCVKNITNQSAALSSFAVTFADRMPTAENL